MNYFRYKLIDIRGRVRNGLIDLPFESTLSALTYLERQGGTILLVQRLPFWLGAAIAAVTRFFQTKISEDELTEALANIAVMLHAGISLLPTLRETFGETPNPTLTRMGRDMIMRVESGSSLSEAASFYPHIFPSTVLFLIRMGEESGQLDRTLKDAADHVRRLNRIKKEVKRAMIYPAFMFTGIFVALGFWLYVVVPTVTDLFTQLQVPLPEFTKMVIATSNWLVEHFALAAAILISTIVTFKLLIARSQPLRFAVHGLLLKIPVLGNILHTFNLAFISEYLSLLLAAGVDVMHSLEVITATLSNEVYRERLEHVRQHLLRGNRLRESFATAKIFPPFVVRMVGVGEESGSLGTQLNYVAEEYQNRLGGMVATISSTVEPIALMVGGSLFVVVAGGLFLPIYQLVGGITSGG